MRLETNTMLAIFGKMWQHEQQVGKVDPDLDHEKAVYEAYKLVIKDLHLVAYYEAYKRRAYLGLVDRYGIN